MANAKKEIVVVTGSRAEYGLLRSALDAIVAHPTLELRLLVTGMHTLVAYGDTQSDIEKDGYLIDCVVPISEHTDMLGALTEEILGIQKYCEAQKPDCMLVLGDRDEVFAAAIVAAHLNIPIAHIHGGDITGPGVDESIRHSITKMAHLHFPGSSASAKRIEAMGEESWRITNAGSITLDYVLSQPLVERAELAKILGLDQVRPWMTVLQHPTVFDHTPLEAQIGGTTEALAAYPEYEKVILYPNTDTGTELFVEYIKKLKSERHHIFPSLPRKQYMSLLKESEVLVGNSSSGMIEVCALGTPAVNIGNRQRGRESAASVYSVPYDSSHIVDAIAKAIELKKSHRGQPFPSPYGTGGVGQKIAQVLAEQLSNPQLLVKQVPK